MKKAYLIILKQNAYSLKKNYFCMMQKKNVMKGTKGSETKALIRETAFKQFLTKDYSMVPLKDIEKASICREDVCHITILQNKNCLLM